METSIRLEPFPDSPWGKVQLWQTLCPGVFWVITASHGGIVVDFARAKQVFSPAALQCAFTENGCYCFEEFRAGAVAIRELMDKGLFTAPVNMYFVAGQYEQIINKSVQRYYPEYWQVRERTIAAKNRPTSGRPATPKAKERER
ncbi:MAG: hypothetical protein HDT26_14100 [Subdoligranulum sp.]|nr:hypothetical protein [Subdoligranulum sp.]